jgi:tetratricopeptide (TPR) repeat protein
MVQSVKSGHETDHLNSATLHGVVSGGLRRAALRRATAHLDQCDECTAALGDVIRAARATSAEEEAALARIPTATPDELVARLRPAITASNPLPDLSRRSDRRTLLVAAMAAAVVLASGLYVHENIWLPAITERTATETLTRLVELRQGTGRIPLRYFREFERASVTRSSFDVPPEDETELVESLRLAVERSPTPRARLVLGLLLMDEGRLDEAEEHLEQATEENPQSVDAWNGLAVLSYERAQREGSRSYEHLQRGLACLRRAQAIDPDELRVMYNFGMFYEELSMTGAAVQAWQRYLRHDASSAWADEAAFQLSRLQPQ